jgi:hypothetical protein
MGRSSLAGMFYVRASFGRWVQLYWRPAGPLLWAGPAVAVLCGLITSTAWRWDAATILRAALAYFLADPVLGAVWAGAAELSASSPMASESAADVPHLPIWPYALARSPSERLRLWLEKVWQRCRTDAAWAGAIGGLIMGSAFALLLAVLMGAAVSRLVLIALALAGLGVLSRPGPVGQARLGALLPAFFAWLVAHAALSPLSLRADWLAALYAFVVYSYAMLIDNRRWQRWASLGNIAQLLVVTLLALLGKPLYAGAVGLLLTGQWLLQAALLDEGRPLLYWRWGGLFLAASMLVAALGLAR